MTHIHEVYDSDMRFSINPITRTITPKMGKGVKGLIQYDHNSERVTFEVPRFIEGHDMSTCNRVEVHYANVDRFTLVRNEGVYEVDDIKVDDENESTVVCTWLVSQNATQLVGPLEFSLSYACVDGDRVDYVWGTRPFTEIEVQERLNSAGTIITQYADVLQSWWKKLFVIEGGTVDENSSEAVTFWIGTHAEYDVLPDDEKNIENRLYFFEDDPSIQYLNARLEVTRDELYLLMDGLNALPTDIMRSSVYDSNGDGVVDSAETLGGVIRANDVVTNKALDDIRGKNDGIATLDKVGKIPMDQLPIDDLNINENLELIATMDPTDSEFIYEIKKDRDGNEFALKKAIVVIHQSATANKGYIISALISEGGAYDIMAYMRSEDTPRYYSGRVEFIQRGNYWFVSGAYSARSSDKGPAFSNDPAYVPTDNLYSSPLENSNPIRSIGVNASGSGDGTAVGGITISVYGVRA